MLTHKKRQRGFFLIELATALAILATLLTAFALGLHGFAACNRYHLARQHCIAAAQAQLDSLALRNTPLPDHQIDQLWPQVQLTTTTGPWQDLQLIQVTARRPLKSKTITITMSRYVEAPPSQGTPQP